ncbi:hypothetical protein UFOVP777_35, partial [uncultured Caudovirales phage]
MNTEAPTVVQSTPAHQPSVNDHLELAFVRVLRETKNSLDGHMSVYMRNPDNTSSTSFGEAVSISAVQRTGYEACAMVEEVLKLHRVSEHSIRGKHRLCLRLTRKFITDTHTNNLIVDHPRADATKFGLGLVLFLTALHHALREVTDA